MLLGGEFTFRGFFFGYLYTGLDSTNQRDLKKNLRYEEKKVPLDMSRQSASLSEKACRAGPGAMKKKI